VSSVFASALINFVQSGGVLVTESRFAILDENGSLRSHAPGAGLHEALGFEEENFSARFRDSIALGSQELVFHDDYFQELCLKNNSRALLKTQGGLPALVESSLGAGKCLHVPFILGHKLEFSESESNALGYFEKLFPCFRGALCPVVETIKKGIKTDVSMLLDKNGKIYMAGICNYSEAPDTVVLATKAQDANAFLPDGSQVKIEYDGLLTIEIPPRSIQAIHFKQSHRANLKLTNP
jgi:hypothetical protein